MPRKRRSCPAGMVFHLCNRSAGQIPLFQNPYDYFQILDVFREALEKFPVSIFAYCIMPNHWHLLLRARQPKAVSRFMHWFGTTHATRWRKSHNAVGRGAVYQNRFRSHLVVGASAFVKTAAYIERNALDAKLVTEATAWPWSSAATTPLLPVEPWPTPKPGHWHRLLAQSLGAEIFGQIRYAELSSQPLRIYPSAEKGFLNEAA